jgi:tetratricopeptide (TPR) repeat protein
MGYHRRNQPIEVLACAARAAEHWQDSAPRTKAGAILLRGHGHQQDKDYPAAIAAYHKVLEISRAISSESKDVAVVLSSLAGAEKANKDHPAAERDYREALRIAKKINFQEGIATYTGGLASLALDREQWAEAKSLAREALALAEKVGRLEMIASDCHRLATALVRAHGRAPQPASLQEALSLSRRAVEIYTRLRHPSLQSAQETLAEIEAVISKQ